MTTHLDTLRSTALSWWENQRPVGWTLEQHLANPTINTMNDCERNLARAVAALLTYKPVCPVGVCELEAGHEGQHESKW